jgi:hypothetical protein
MRSRQHGSNSLLESGYRDEGLGKTPVEFSQSFNARQLVSKRPRIVHVMPGQIDSAFPPDTRPDRTRVHTSYCVTS